MTLEAHIDKVLFVLAAGANCFEVVGNTGVGATTKTTLLGREFEIIAVDDFIAVCSSSGTVFFIRYRVDAPGLEAAAEVVRRGLAAPGRLPFPTAPVAVILPVLGRPAMLSVLA